ncbi:hypothetical protein F2Q70_00022429 [Brassica cretica]|uniref:Uncharacterized protein n=1 Tax=Brassica cretica TaxID=69181 RepID=A0A8S9GFW0_BRACR|nr:hypothetical protein F2Q70_00022429 [Brassica cretica]
MTMAIDARRAASSHIALVVPDTSPRLNIEGEADSYDFGVGEGYLCSTKADKLKCLVIDDEGVLHTSHAAEDESLIDRDTKSLIDIHQTTESEVRVNDNIDYGHLTPDEFGIFRDPEDQSRAMDERILNISMEDIDDCHEWIQKLLQHA